MHIQKNKFRFMGKRFNNHKKSEDKNEPYPLELLNMLKEVATEIEPFAIDIDNDTKKLESYFDEISVNI